MQGRLERLEERLDGLVKAVEALDERLRRLEGGAEAAPPAGEPEAWAASGWPAARAGEGRGDEGRGRLAALVPLLGRTLLVLGGGYLMRAVTEMPAVPDSLGLLAGYLYALGWVVAGDRAAVAGRRLDAGFHVVTGVLVAFPLVVEAATRFAVVGVAGASLGAAVAAAVVLAVAVRHAFAAAAWAGVVGGSLAALALVRAGDDPTAPLVFLLVLGVAAFLLGARGGWRGAAWVPALSADLGIAVLGLGVLGERFATPVTTALVLHLALFGGYLAAVAWRALVHGRAVGTLDVFQTLAAGIVGFGGGVRIGLEVGRWSGPLGAAAILLGLAAYLVAFSPRLRFDRRRNFFFFTSLALLLVLAGSYLLLAATPAAWAWSSLGLAAALASARLGRVTLSLHSTIYLLAALLVSGLARAATEAFWLADPPSWRPIAVAHAAVLVAMVATLLVPAARRSDSWGRWARVPRAALLLFAVWAAGGATIWWLARPGGADGAPLDPGALSALRTGLLAVAAAALAALARRPRFAEAGWLVYPLLIVACVRVLAQDLLQGRPVTLFVSLGLLGASLMASSWLLRQEGRVEVEG